MDLRPLIYIVDDDAAVRDALRATLSLLDAEVRAFASAREFLAAFLPERPACLVLDLRMPETSGLELLKLVRDRDSLLPVIVITGQGSIADAVAAMKMGAVEFLEKPDCILVLRDRVGKALERNRHCRHRRRDRSAAVVSLAALSPEEKTVLQATASGEPDKTVASRLEISIRTIQLRRARAMKKLGVRTKADLIRVAHIAETDDVSS
jgi:FixJ family two-component response regulator